MTIGELIRHTRKEKGMTQKQVAELCGMADSAIRKYESGSQTPKLKTIQRIAAALGVEWTELVPEEQQGQTVVDHMTELIKNTASSGKVLYHKLTDAEQYRAGFLKFHSDEDRIAHFYRLLNEDGKLAAGVCFFKHLDNDTWGEVADYVMSLCENPLYQRTDTPKSSPSPQEGTDTTPATEGAESTQKPSEDKK